MHRTTKIVKKAVLGLVSQGFVFLIVTRIRTFMPTSEFDHIRQVAVEAARAAGACLLEGFSLPKDIRRKDGIHNLVTQFDLKSEDLIVSLVRGHFPDHHFLAEEGGGSSISKGYRWIIDPLDGTVNFAHGIPIFSVSIGVELDGQIVVGVVYQPVLDELFVAVRGHGAFLNDVPIHVSSTATMNESILVTGFPYDVSKNATRTLEHFAGLVQRGIPVRRLGSAAVDMAYVACGRFDGFWESALQPWDVAAGILLIEEAGGRVSAYDGSAHTLQQNTILSTNGVIHAEFVYFLQS